ncbi:protein BatD [Endozoicomonas sp. SM1973]|uniref:Protein BatD n=1 Tax=Spartinivicinus marinus TaxID=2994442 RepID=A0A853I409_9GAMM|nr:BatD family protein [Spartinivicinus marinus]MCX4029853.1 BatD family protein [Spartinivicinus marinus]NYZ64904.1 protein BatD [Spartinivicinus marinus]
MVTRKRSALIWLTTLLMGWSVICHAKFTASVDRTIINQNETVELTLRSDRQEFGAEPDLSPLHELFSVLGRSQRSQYQSVNGKTQSWTDWIITLRPKQSGYVVIPPISLRGEKTKPITLDVKPAGSNQQSSGKNVSPVFIEASLDKESVFVQEQAVLTILIYHSVPLYDDSRITPLTTPNVISQQLGDVKNYETIINGQRYGVFELKYAIFPQQSGEILIPALKFTSTVASQSRRNSPFNMFPRQIGTPVEEYSPEIKLTVKTPPASAKGNWLPAQKLTLTENWSTDTSQLKVGDSVTRTIEIKAEGLTAAQLPPLTTPELNGVKLYPDKSQTKDIATDQGIIGQRIESIALVPTQAGTIKLPEIRYRWFNTTSQTMEEAVLPAKQITIAPVTTSQDQPASPAVPTTAPTPPVVAAQPQIKADLTESSPSSTGVWPWLTLLFAVLWLITLGLWWRQRQPATVNKRSTPSKIENTSAQKLFNGLLNSCDQKNLTEIRRLFVQWSQQALDNTQIQNLQKADECWQTPALSTFLQALDNQLYGNQTLPFDCAAFKQQIKQLKPTKQVKPAKHSLMPLYPSLSN